MAFTGGLGKFEKVELAGSRVSALLERRCPHEALFCRSKCHAVSDVQLHCATRLGDWSAHLQLEGEYACAAREAIARVVKKRRCWPSVRFASGNAIECAILYGVKFQNLVLSLNCLGQTV
jgi:hypothetical protein